MHISIFDPRKGPAVFAAALLTALTLNGCGGSSAGGGPKAGGPPPNGKPVTTNSGPLTFTAATALPPVTMGGRNAAVVGFAGAAITSATAKLPLPSSTNAADALQSTLIAYDDNGQTKIYNYGTGATFPIGEEIGRVTSTSPFFSGVGNRLAIFERPVAAPTGQIFTEALDGSAKVAVGPPTKSLNPSPTYSPDGLKIAYVCVDANGKTRLALINAGGGTPTFVTDGTDTPANPVWTPDGSRVVYVDQAPGDTRWHVKTFDFRPGFPDINTFISADGPPPILTFLGGDDSDVVESYCVSGTFFTERFRGQSRVQLFVGPDIINGISGSPIGKFLLIGDTAANSILVMDANEPRPNPTLPPTTLITGNGSVRSPNWGPYVNSKTLLGTGGVFGASAGAILYGTTGTTAGGIVAVDATDESSISVQPQTNTNPTQSVILANVTGTGLTSLKYLNGVNGLVVTVLSGPSPNVSGALVSFDADTGNVLAVVTYAASLAKTGSSFNGKVLSAFDERGKNIAPNGAHRVSFDTKSGRLLTVN